MGTLPGALRGQVKLHSEKCCGTPYDFLVISGVWTLNTLHVSISANYQRHWNYSTRWLSKHTKSRWPGNFQAFFSKEASLKISIICL